MIDDETRNHHQDVHWCIEGRLLVHFMRIHWNTRSVKHIFREFLCGKIYSSTLSPLFYENKSKKFTKNQNKAHFVKSIWYIDYCNSSNTCDIQGLAKKYIQLWRSIPNIFFQRKLSKISYKYNTLMSVILIITRFFSTNDLLGENYGTLVTVG